MQERKSSPKKGKSISSLIVFGVIMFNAVPASAGLLHYPFNSSIIDPNATDSSGVASINPPSPSFPNGDNPNPSNSNNNNNGGGGSLSPFTNGQSSTNSSNNSGSADDNNDSNSGGTETDDIIASVSGEGLVDPIPVNSEVDDLLAVASMLQENGNNSDISNTTGTNTTGTNTTGTDTTGTDTPGSDGPGTVTPTATPIPEPTSVTALAIMGLMGIVAKRNNSNHS